MYHGGSGREKNWGTGSDIVVIEISMFDNGRVELVST